MVSHPFFIHISYLKNCVQVSLLQETKNHDQ